jgi:thiol-disulfide isomerase/thioredoxin
MYRFFALSLALSLALVASAAAENVELLDFTADSCPACRQMEPVLQGLASSGMPVRRVDVNHERELAARFQVQYLPTFVAVADGREVDRQVGATSPERLREMLQRAAESQETREDSQETRDKRREPETFAQQTSPALDSRLSSLDSFDSPDAQLLASTARIRVEDPQGISYGTGTIISARHGEAIVLTCGHLFRESQGRSPVQIELFEAAAASPRVAEVMQGEVLGYDLTRDVGVVRIRPNRPIQAAPLASRDLALQPGDKAASVGCDHGKEPTVWQTRLTAINRYIGPANVEAAGTPVQGRSGGGLFNARGELIGVCFAADDKGNEGLYVGVPAIYEELDRLQLTSVVTTPGAMAVATEEPSQSGARSEFVSRQVDAADRDSRGLVPVAPPASMLASAQSTPLTQDEQAALEEIGQRSRAGEVIVIIRPKSAGDRCEILSLENPSQVFIDQLSAIGNKATVPRFTSEKQPRPSAAFNAKSTSQRAVNPSGTQDRRGMTDWHAVLPDAR